MPRSNNVSTQNNFSKGLITEATGLTFPENACTEADNCEFSYLGVSTRRLGFDLENTYTKYTKDLTGNVVVTYLWNNVAGAGDRVYVVVQMGDLLHFYKVTADSSLSSNKHSNTINLVTYAPAGVTSVANLECQFSSGNGLLFVTGSRLNSFYVTYDANADTFAATQITIQVRDFKGDATDALAVDNRPASTLAALTAAHTYNLQNQGWTTTTLTAWDAARTDMPSNCDVNWYFKNSADAFDFTIVNNTLVGNSAAPKGHYIYSVYNINRSSNFAGATDVTIDLDRCTTSAFFAGRVFYSGLNTKDTSSKIYFSQIVEEPTQYGKCYQSNDPTSETLFDLLPTDGGVIDIIGAGIILKMIPVQNAIAIFASKGIWYITGSQGAGFAANDYAIHKLSSTTNSSATSFVDAEGLPYWWNLEGIYTLTLDPQTNVPRINSITDNTIRSLILSIPSENKQYVRGVYDQFTKRIQWIYKTTTAISFADKYVYDGLLTLSLLSKGFYTWSVDTTNVKINSITNVFGFSGTFDSVNVVNSATLVVDSGVQVIAFLASGTGVTSVIKYFVSFNDGVNPVVTWAENYKDTYLDWESFDSIGQIYDSFFVTGYAIRGQAIKKFQENYVNIFTDNAVDSSYKILGQWNYAVNANTGRWSSEQTFNVTADNFQYRPNKIKIRGNGLACQLRITNNGNLPFTIIGWSVFETANQGI